VPKTGLSDDERYALYAVGEALIPPAPGERSADEAGFAAHFVDEYLALRPEHLGQLKDVIADINEATDVEAFLRQMQATDPASFEFLTFVVVGSYFLNEQVRQSYGYRGQTGESQDGTVQPEHDVGGMLDSVRKRGPIYRDVKP